MVKPKNKGCHFQGIDSLFERELNHLPSEEKSGIDCDLPHVPSGPNFKWAGSGGESLISYTTKPAPDPISIDRQTNGETQSGESNSIN